MVSFLVAPASRDQIIQRCVLNKSNRWSVIWSNHRPIDRFVKSFTSERSSKLTCRFLELISGFTTTNLTQTCFRFSYYLTANSTQVREWEIVKDKSQGNGLKNNMEEKRFWIQEFYWIQHSDVWPNLSKHCSRDIADPNSIIQQTSSLVKICISFCHVGDGPAQSVFKQPLIASTARRQAFIDLSTFISSFEH